MGSSFDSVWVPTLMGAFLTSYEGVLNEAWTKPITREISEKAEFVKLVDLGTVGSVRQFSGPRQATKPRAYTQTQQNLPFELSMAIDIEDYDRDRLGIYETKAQEMGGKFADHINRLVIADIAANPTCFDGVAFFATTHPVNGTTQANDLSSSQIPALDVAVPAAPTAVEMALIITQLIGYIYTLIDESGDPINGGAKEFKFATSNPTIWAAINTVISAMQLSQGQTNQVIAGLSQKGWKFTSELDVRLGSTTSAVFFCFRADSPVKSFVWNEEKGLEIQYLGPGSTVAVMQNQYVWAAKAVRSVAVGRYQHSFRCTLS